MSELPFLWSLNPNGVEVSKSLFSDGSIKSIISAYYDENGREYKRTTIRNRKNGTTKYTIVSSYGQIQYHSRYDKDGTLKVEKIYSYNFRETLICIETKRNGTSRFQRLETDVFGESIEKSLVLI